MGRILTAWATIKYIVGELQAVWDDLPLTWRVRLAGVAAAMQGGVAGALGDWLSDGLPHIGWHGLWHLVEHAAFTAALSFWFFKRQPPRAAWTEEGRDAQVLAAAAGK